MKKYISILFVVLTSFGTISSNEISREVVEVFGGNRPQDEYNVNDLNSNDIGPNLGVLLKKIIKSELKKEARVTNELELLVKSHERKIEELINNFSELNATLYKILDIFHITDNNDSSSNYKDLNIEKSSIYKDEMEINCMNQSSGSWKFDYESGKLMGQNAFNESECNSSQIHLTEPLVYFQLSVNVTENPSHYSVFKIQMLNCENATNEDEESQMSLIEYKLFSYKSFDDKVLFFSSIDLNFGSNKKSKIETISFPLEKSFLAVWTFKLNQKEMSVESFVSTKEPMLNISDTRLVSSLNYNTSQAMSSLEICGVRVKKSLAIWPLQTQIRNGRNEEGEKDIEPFQYDNFFLSTNQQMVRKRRDQILKITKQKTQNQTSEGIEEIRKNGINSYTESNGDKIIDMNDEGLRIRISMGEGVEPKKIQVEQQKSGFVSVSNIKNHFKTASTSIASFFGNMKSKIYSYASYGK